MIDYCYYCNKYVTLVENKDIISEFKMEIYHYHCEKCGRWIKTVRKPIVNLENND